MYHRLYIGGGLDESDSCTLPDEDVLALLDLLDLQGKFVELREPSHDAHEKGHEDQAYLEVQQVVGIWWCRGSV
jgi:hypothetical protein